MGSAAEEWNATACSSSIGWCSSARLELYALFTLCTVSTTR